MKRGITLSASLHIIICCLLIFGLPHLFDPARFDEPQAISVEILPISAQSNVMNKIKPTEKKPEKKETPTEQAKPKKKPEPPVKKEKAVEKKPDPVVKKETPKEKPKEDKKKDDKKKDEDDLEAILKAVEDTAKEQKESEAPAQETETPSKSDTAYIDSLPLSMSEKDAIRNQLAKCWNPPMGAKDAHDLATILKVTFNQDGSLVNVYLAKTQQLRYNSDTFFRSAVDSAMRAVRACTPLQGMPAEKYESWKDVELTFDPRDMLY